MNKRPKKSIGKHRCLSCGSIKNAAWNNNCVDCGAPIQEARS